MNLNYAQFEITLARQKQQILLDEHKRELEKASQKRQMNIQEYEREIAEATHRKNLLIELEQKRINFWNNIYQFRRNGKNHSPRYPSTIEKSSPVQSNQNSPSNADVSSNYGDILAESQSINSPNSAQSPGSIISDMEEEKMPQSPSQIGVNSEEEGEKKTKSKQKPKVKRNIRNKGYKQYCDFELEKAKASCIGKFNQRKAKIEILKQWKELDDNIADMWAKVAKDNDPMNIMLNSGAYSMNKENGANSPSSPSFQRHGSEGFADPIHTQSPETIISDLPTSNGLFE